MTNLLLMADDEDADLGDFFRLCAEKVKEHASSLEQCECKIFPSNKLRTNIMLHYCIDTFDSQSFVCGAFMHGNETSLFCGEQDIVTEEDALKFKNSIVYFCACHTGRKLLKTLVETGGALAAIGYKDAFHVQKFFNMQPVFSDCATVLFKYFFQNRRLSEAVKMMKEDYTNAIDNIYKKDPLAASFLLVNRDSIAFYGTGNLDLNNVFNQ